MGEASNRPWYLDKRVGCLAIYPLDIKPDYAQCLDGLEDYVIHYRSGHRVFLPARSLWESIGTRRQWSHWEVNPQHLADAALIVRAVNAHDALVDACEAAFKWMAHAKVHCGLTLRESYDEVTPMLSAALVAAKEKEVSDGRETTGEAGSTVAGAGDSDVDERRDEGADRQGAAETPRA